MSPEPPLSTGCTDPRNVLHRVSVSVSVSVQALASTQESNGTAPSSFVTSPQLPHSAFSSQVQASPTRYVTGDVMSATLAEAAS